MTPVSRAMTIAIRGSVHNSVGKPCAEGPASNARSIFTKSRGPSRGLRPARPAAFNARRPFAAHA